MADNGAAAATEKRKRTRSPAYPFINLETALARARAFHKKEQRNSANIAVAMQHWGYGSDSSNGAQTIAALTSFGLLQDEGTGDKRKVKLTEDGLRILLDERPDSQERAALIKKAALSPKIHQELWKRWGTDLPSDASLKHTLLFEWEPRFNENAVDFFIREYRATIGFAKLLDSDKVSQGADSTADAEETKILNIGDYAQWESGGQLKFPEAKRVTGFSEDGQFFFVEGQKSGFPIGEAHKEEPPANAPRGAALNPVPREIRRPTGGSVNMRQDVFSVDEGEVVLSWPVALSQDSITDIKEWLKIAERKIARSLKASIDQPDSQIPEE